MNRRSSVPVILLAFANDRADEQRYLRNLPQEHRRLRAVLRRAEDDGLCEVVELANATLDDILNVFLDPNYRDRVAVFHFGGHANGFELLLESETGSAAAANAGGLAKFLGAQESLYLVFLNGCSTEQQTQGLLSAGVDAVISTSCAINDSVATKLATRFYQSLAGGTALSLAFKHATAAAQTESNGSTRALYAKSKKIAVVDEDRLPWALHLRGGSEAIGDWNLPDVVDDPLFGLPEPPELDLGTTPYRHLEWYQSQHAELFFGRGREIRDLYAKVTDPGTAPIVLYYGQSGVGKSSLLDAGLIPRLSQSQKVVYLRRDRETGLQGTFLAGFAAENIEHATNEAWFAIEQRYKKPMTVILDQLEEVYTRPVGSVSEELDLFWERIHGIFQDPARRPQGRLVISFRKEWLAEIKRKLTQYKLPYTEVFLDRLDRRGIIDVVAGPSKTQRLKNHFQLEVEDGLAEMIADDLLEDDESVVAPTLQVLLSRMWHTAVKEDSSTPQFTRDIYHSLRRRGVLLRDFLDQQLSHLEAEHRKTIPPDLLLDLLTLHTTSMGTAEQRSLEDLRKTYPHYEAMLGSILDGCKDAYLLTMSGKDSPRSRLAHDTLAPLVRERFDTSDRPGQRARRILENRAAEWRDGKIGAVLDDEDLAIVEHGQRGMRGWTADETRLVEASRHQRRRRQIKGYVFNTAGVLAIAGIILVAFIASSYAVIAEKHARTAESLLAKSLILPLSPQATEVSDAEYDALWELSLNKSDSVHMSVFRTAIEDTDLSERVMHRMPMLVRAAIGIDEKRRNQALELVRQTFDRSTETETNGESENWRTYGVAASLANELRPIDEQLDTQIASTLVDAMKECTDPRGVELLGSILLKTSQHLRYKQAHEVQQSVYNQLMAKTEVAVESDGSIVLDGIQGKLSREVLPDSKSELIAENPDPDKYVALKPAVGPTLEPSDSSSESALNNASETKSTVQSPTLNYFYRGICDQLQIVRRDSGMRRGVFAFLAQYDVANLLNLYHQLNDHDPAISETCCDTEPEQEEQASILKQFLSEEADIETLCEVLLAETEHARVVFLADVLAEHRQEIPSKRRRDVLNKLCTWLRFLPPIESTTQNAGVQLEYPTRLGQAILKLKPDYKVGASTAQRYEAIRISVLAAHALMRAMQQPGYQSASASLGEMFSQVIDSMPPSLLAGLYKAPWCLGLAQESTLKTLSRKLKMENDSSAEHIRRELAKRVETVDEIVLYPSELQFDENRPAFMAEKE